MINALKPSFREFGRAAFIVDALTQRFFRYAIVSESEKQWSTPIRNLISNQANTVIQTTWDLPFESNKQIRLESGDIYKIMRCKRIVTDVNEQSLGLVKASFSAYWVLELAR